MIKAIEMERALLKSARSRTDYLIDTSHLSSAQLKERITTLFMGDTSKAMLIQQKAMEQLANIREEAQDLCHGAAAKNSKPEQ